MSDESIRMIRASDPARHMPAVSVSAREATRSMILSSPLQPASEAESGAKVPSRLSRRRVLVLATVALLVVVPTVVAWVEFVGIDKQTALEGFYQAQKEFPLPAGAEWTVPAFLLSPDEGTLFGVSEGRHTAFMQSWELWCWEWIAAHDAQDVARQQAATSALERMVDMVRVIQEGESENGSTNDIVVDDRGLDVMRQMIALAHQGDASAIEAYLEANAAGAPYVPGPER